MQCETIFLYLGLILLGGTQAQADLCGKNVYYDPLDIPGHSRSVEPSVASCKTRCINTNGCSYFSYYEDDGGCHLSGNAAKKVGTGYKTTSGSKRCSSCSMDLVNKINDYRQQNGLSRLPTDETLCQVAYYHARDTVENRPVTRTCNLHSWSRNGIDSINWTGCCYTEDHSEQDCMWRKPREFNSGFGGDGFEISYGDGTGSVNARGALNGWKESGGHNEVILNRGIWTQNWAAIGAAYYKGSAHAWFANEI